LPDDGGTAIIDVGDSRAAASLLHSTPESVGQRRTVGSADIWIEDLRGVIVRRASSNCARRANLDERPVGEMFDSDRDLQRIHVTDVGDGAVFEIELNNAELV
jgi:hypothetical protein